MGTNLKDGIQSNADSASKLEIARKINGIAFDGTRDITIPTNSDWGNISNKPSTFPPTTHNHDTDYLRKTEKASDSDKLDGYDSTYFAPNSHNHDSIYSKLGHTHDDRYFTESECNANFLGKNAKSVDSDKLNGIDSTGFARAYSSSYSFGGNQNKITTTQFITILEGLGAFSTPYWIARGSWSYAGNQIINDTGCGDIHLAGCTVEVVGTKSAFTIMIHTSTTSSGGVVNGDFVYVNNGDTYSPKWRRLYNTESQPNFKDLAGLPSTFPPSSHTHDDRYYTETEVNSNFLGKNAKATDSDKLDGFDSSYFANSNHTHDNRYLAWRTETDTVLNFNDFKDNGIFNVSSSSLVPNAPFGGAIYGVLVCIKRSDGVSQEFISQDGSRWYRLLINQSQQWSEWQTNISKHTKQVTDFNTAIELGEYDVGSSNTLPNAPYTGAIYGTLRNSRLGVECLQQFTDYTSSVYMRSKNYQGVWSSWKRLVKFDDMQNTINSTSGYQAFPSGICIQWGQFTANNGVANISFPVSFANNAYAISGNPIDPNAHYISFKGEWSGGAQVTCDWGASPVGGRWIAVGTL